MISALRWAGMSLLMFHKLWGTKSQDSVHRPQLLKRGESKRIRTEAFRLTSLTLTARPNRLTNPQLTNVLLLKPGVGQNIVTQASPDAWNFSRVLILPFPSMQSSSLFFFFFFFFFCFFLLFFSKFSPCFLSFQCGPRKRSPCSQSQAGCHGECQSTEYI